MKKIYLLITALAFGFMANAQSIPNGNFESWTTANGDVPVGFINSNSETFFRCHTPLNCVKVADPYHGNFAVQLTTNVGSGDTCFGYVLNVNNPNGNSPCQWQGGTPFTQTPTGARGYYKSNIAVGDTGGILFAFKKNGACLGMYMLQLYGVHSTYTPFSIAFNPPLSMAPDTMVFAGISSDAFNNIALNGSMLQLDSISFTGIATQPANFNGDFENWAVETFEQPDFWYMQGGGGPGGTNGVSRTTDKNAGNYAVELKTYLGDRCNSGNNCHPAANGGYISTGWYPQNCGGGCNQQGGYPFSNIIDTLCFYYKYAPSGNDTAQCMINFKKNGSNVGGAWKSIYTPAATYQYAEIPFNNFMVMDTAIISFQSSSWQDTLLSYIGSDFKVDEVHFKSQPLFTGVKTFDAATGIKIFPNPSNDGNFMVSNVQTYDLVRVSNVYGQEVHASIKKENDYAKIHIETPGAYFVTVNARGKITTLRVIVGQQ